MSVSSPTPYVPLSRRPEWHDFTPLSQNDPPVSSVVVPIAYPDEYRDATAYMRAVLATGERSRRVQALAGEVIEMNAAHYTAWWLRRRCLECLVAEAQAGGKGWEKGGDEAVEALYDEELAYARQMADENPKNYQVWFHRQAIVAQTQDPSHELEAVARTLKGDGKNYHAWAYRQWLLQTFQTGWEAEKQFVDELLEEDPRNNSAWNQRWFIVHAHELSPHHLMREGGEEGGNTEAKAVAAAAIRDREMAYAWTAIREEGGREGGRGLGENESAWAYLRGYLKETNFKAVGWKERLLALAEEGKEGGKEGGSVCVPLMALAVEVHEAEGDDASLEEAVVLVESLGERWDRTRRGYWLKSVLGRINRKLLREIGTPVGRG
ncbi:hypothetical protein VYU27_008731 [Nannochloropsis oceanica]